MDVQELRLRVRDGIRTIAQSAETVLEVIRGNTQSDFTPSAFDNSLGAQLAAMLKELRYQRAVAMDLSLRHARITAAASNSSLDAYLQALSDMRSTIGLWLTVHATRPNVLEVEASDFETQCFSALGAGILWLDSLAQAQGEEAEDGLSQERVLIEVFAASQREELHEFSAQNWQLGSTPSQAAAHA